MTADDVWRAQVQGLGGYIRAQRRLANMSLRDLAELTRISNPYLSQIERGLHEPSVRVLRSIATALNISGETLLAQAGLVAGLTGVPPDGAGGGTEAAIRADERLSEAQKEALLAVYRSFVASDAAAGVTGPRGTAAAEPSERGDSDGEHTVRRPRRGPRSPQ